MEDQQKKPVLTEAPIELIRELASRMSFVALNLKRRNGRGAMGFVAGITANTTDLADGSLERVLSEEYGGGEFHVIALNPENKMDQVVPTYSTSVDGVPKVGGDPNRPRSSREERVLRMTMPLQQHAAPVGALPGQPYFPPPLQPQVPRPSDFMERTPDAIASEHVQMLREELQQLNTKMEEKDRRWENRVENLRADNERLKAEQRERDLQHEKDLQNARFRDLEARLANPAKPAIDVVGVATLLGTFVPVFTALVTAGKDRAALMATQQTEAAKLQIEGIKTMVASTAKKPDLDLVELIKVALPLWTAMQANRDPSKMAEIITAQGENQLGLLSLLGNMMNNMAGESEHPMMRIVQEAIAGAVNVAERMAARAEQPIQAQVAARPLPAQPSPIRRRVAAATQSAPAPAPAVPPESVAEPVSPDQLARMLLADHGWPLEMRTQEWHAIIRDIHDPAADVARAARALGEGLDKLYDAEQLPAGLSDIFNCSVDQLDEVALSFFESLPVWANQLRAKALGTALADVFRDTGVQDADAPAQDGAAVADGDDGGEDAAGSESDDDGVVQPVADA